MSLDFYRINKFYILKIQLRQLLKVKSTKH